MCKLATNTAAYFLHNNRAGATHGRRYACTHACIHDNELSNMDACPHIFMQPRARPIVIPNRMRNSLRIRIRKYKHAGAHANTYTTMYMVILTRRKVCKCRLTCGNQHAHQQRPAQPSHFYANSFGHCDTHEARIGFWRIWIISGTDVSNHGSLT